MIEISVAHNTARLLGTLAFLDTGTGNATMSLYATSRPAGGAAPGDTPLAEMALPKPCATLTGGVLVLGAPTAPAPVLGTGMALWARFSNGDGGWAFDCDVSDEAGTGEVKLTTVQLYTGGLVPLSTAAPSVIG